MSCAEQIVSEAEKMFNGGRKWLVEQIKQLETDRDTYKALSEFKYKCTKGCDARIKQLEQALQYVNDYIDDYALALEKNGAMDRSIWDVHAVVKQALAATPVDSSTPTVNRKGKS